MPSFNYEKLRGNEESHDSETLLPNEHQQLRFARHPKLAITFKIILLFSLLCNAVLLSQAAFPWGKDNDVRGGFTEYVGIKTDLEIPFTPEYGSIYDPVWDSPQMSETLGVVALDLDYIKANNLPTSMRYPWDENKRVYVLSFHHNIHCLGYLRQSVLESHAGLEQSLGIEHLSHCLNVLRDDAMCHADDTPRYTGRMHSQFNVTEPTAGVDQNRKCRDYNKLYEWSIKHSACYDATVSNPDDPSDYYKACPDGSKPWE